MVKTKGDHLQFSIIIRCGDDDRILRCIDSIDEEVEVVAAMLPNPILEKKLREMDVVICKTPKGNLSVVSNLGIESSANERFFLTDSDTIFEPGCIIQMYRALDDHKAARAGIKFDHTIGRYPSKLVAEARHYVNSLPLFFTPGVAMRKEILEDIGGFYFDDPVPYAVDADLDHRIKKSGLDVAWLMDRAFIRHDSESMAHDLRAAKRIGMGCRKSVGELTKYEKRGIPPFELKAVKPYQYPDIILNKGIDVALYQLIWDTSYYLGYTRQIFSDWIR